MKLCLNDSFLPYLTELCLYSSLVHRSSGRKAMGREAMGLASERKLLLLLLFFIIGSRPSFLSCLRSSFLHMRKLIFRIFVFNGIQILNFFNCSYIYQHNWPVLSSFKISIFPLKIHRLGYFLCQIPKTKTKSKKVFSGKHVPPNKLTLSL